MSKLLLDKEKTLVILIGTSEYYNKDFWPNLPQSTNNLKKIKEVFLNKYIIGLSEDHIKTLENFSFQEAIEKLEELLDDENIRKYNGLIFYFVGHGFISRREKELVLTCKNTSKDTKTIIRTSLRYEELKKIFDSVNYIIKKRLIILDCCFAGKAAKQLGSGFSKINNEEIQAKSGEVLILAAPESAPAGAGEVFTEFTGIFMNLLENGLVFTDGEKFEKQTPYLDINNIDQYLKDEYKRTNLLSEPQVINNIKISLGRKLMPNCFTTPDILYIMSLTV